MGNLTSQHWGNLYLDGLDHHAQRTLRLPYQRYMDDMAVFADDRSALVDARASIAEWLATHRRLTLKAPDAPILRTAAPQGYLGYAVTPTDAVPGPKARVRLRGNLLRAIRDPRRLEAVTAAWMARWRFGVG